MDNESPMEAFIRAQRETRIIRARKNLLYTFGSTRLPYIFIADSAVNEGDVVMRKGTVTVDPPKIITPGNSPEFEGFGFEEMEQIENEGLVPVLLNRWIHFPNARYTNTSGSIEVVSGPIDDAVEKAINKLDQQSDIRTGVISGPESQWGFSILGYVGQMVARSAPSNIGEFFEHFGMDEN